jgi:hypothetical protein
MVGRFGIRGIQIKNPNLNSHDACREFAKSMMRRINANVITGTVTMILRPELQPARNVFIPWINAIGYISSIETHIQYGSRATTTLGLKYVRRPWEAWTPIDYGTDMDTSAVKQSTSSVTSGTTNPSYSTNQQGQQVGNQATPYNARVRSSTADSAATPRSTAAETVIWNDFMNLVTTFRDDVATNNNFKIKNLDILVTWPKIVNNKPISFRSPYQIEFTMMYGNNAVPNTNNIEKVQIIYTLKSLASDNNFSLMNEADFPNLILIQRVK